MLEIPSAAVAATLEPLDGSAAAMPHSDETAPTHFIVQITLYPSGSLEPLAKSFARQSASGLLWCV